jgi:glycerophosphoryl diester phosphodiesterase
MQRFSTTILVLLLGAAMSSAAEPEWLLNEAFDDVGEKLPAGWRADKDVWRVAGGQLVVDSLRGVARIVAGKPDWQNYEITVTATFSRVATDARWLSIVFRGREPGTTPWSHFCLRFHCRARNGAEFAVRADPETWKVRKRVKVAKDCRFGRPRRLRVVVRGSDVEAFVDGQRVLDSAFCLERETGYVGLAVSGCIARFDDFRVRRLPPTPRLVETPLKPCEVIAHRGFSAVAPENTLASAVRAIRVGASGSECDVRRSSDGALVAMHDSRVDRTTNATGKVARLTLAELRKLDAGAWKSREYAGQQIPTLEEILTVHRGTG